MNTMTIDQKLDLIRKALEHGADIHLSVHTVVGRENAEGIISEIVSGTELGYKLQENRNWFNQSDVLSDVAVTVYFKLNKEERIAKLQEELSGYMEEDVWIDESKLG